MPYTAEQLKERYDKLPADIRKAMDSIDTTNKVVDIGQKYSLMYDQIGELADETSLLLLGLTSSNMFASNLGRRLRVDAGKGALIAHDINAQIFDKMRDSLRKIQNDKAGDDTVAINLHKEEPAKPNPAIRTNMAQAIEKAGGFVIESNPAESAPMGDISRSETLKALEREQPVSPATPPRPTVAIPNRVRLADPLPADRLLEDEEANMDKGPSPLPVKIAESPASIVDTLLSKGVAMPLDTGTPIAASTTQKPMIKAPDTSKARPYDGVDPYRETTN